MTDIINKVPCPICDAETEELTLEICEPCDVWGCHNCINAHNEEVHPPPTAPQFQGKEIPAEDFNSWVTLREAEKEVGIAVQTLRKWYRTGEIETKDDYTVYGQKIQKLVNLGEVKKRAEKSVRYKKNSLSLDVADMDARLTELEYNYHRLRSELTWLKESLLKPLDER